jgi:L-lactate dehydrogenase
VACANAILSQQLAGRVSLYDVNAQRAEGEALDFEHVAPLLGQARVDGGGMDRLDTGGDVCVITAGAKQRPGESRPALLERNAAALDAIATSLEGARLPRVAVVVSNPVDTMTFRLVRRWQGRGVHVLGTGTLLDSMRLRAQLAQWLQISGESVHAWVLGEHGDSGVPLLDSARVAGVSLEAFCARRGIAFGASERARLTEGVRGAAAKVIALKGATCHAIGLVTARVVSAVLRDERVLLPVSAPIDGVCAGVPCRVGRDGAEVLGWPDLSPAERASLEASLAVLRTTCVG